MTRRAPVYRWTFDAATQSRRPVRIGELTQEEARWEFLYDPDYLALGKDAWELDPTGIRTKQRSAFTRVGVVPPPVFCDIALSGWSKDALQKRAGQFLGVEAANSDEPWGWWERLIYAPADGFGSLFVGHLNDKPDVEKALQDALGSVTQASLANTGIESSSGAMGGERPKVSVFMPGMAGENGPPTPVLLKFSLPSERTDSVVAEATALTLGAELGLKVPRHHVKWFNDSPALCIERFDRGSGLTGETYHCVSAATALDLVPGTDVEDPKRSYVMLRSKLKRPEDARELFRRIVLNAVVGNTDDHPWNTSLRQGGLGDWELAPLYDVMPYFERKNRPVFRMALTHTRARAATRTNLITAGKQIAALTDAEVNDIIEVTNVYVRDNWRRVFKAHSKAHSVRDASANPNDWARVFEYDWIGD